MKNQVVEKHYYCDIATAADRDVMQHLINTVVIETGVDEEAACKLVNYIIITYRDYPKNIK